MTDQVRAMNTYHWYVMYKGWDLLLMPWVPIYKVHLSDPGWFFRNQVFSPFEILFIEFNYIILKLSKKILI